MKQFSKILIILSVIVILGSGVVLAASSNLSCDNPEAYPWCKATSSLGGSTGLVNTFYNISLALVGVAAFGVIVYGGILYTISAGNPSKQQDAVEWITGAVYGVVLLFGAYFLLNTINPELVELTEPSDYITPVKTSCDKYVDSSSCAGSTLGCEWTSNKCQSKTYSSASTYGTTGCCKYDKKTSPTQYYSACENINETYCKQKSDYVYSSGKTCTSGTTTSGGITYTSYWCQ